MKLYILTDSQNPHLIKDDKNLVAEFHSQGINAVPTVWHGFSPPKNANVLIRSPWDYTRNANEFLNLLEKIQLSGGQVVNSHEIVRWNIDKSYLLEISNLGVPTVPTRVSLKFGAKDISENEFPIVIKPLVGASGYNTFLVNKSRDISRAAPLENVPVLIQPFISAVQSEGEYSFIFFNKRFSHAVLKTPKAKEFRVQEEHGGSVQKYLPTSEEIEQIQESISLLDRNFAYLRVDVVRQDNKLLVMELEAIEPELFFRFSENGERNFVSVVRAHLEDLKSG